MSNNPWRIPNSRQEPPPPPEPRGRGGLLIAFLIGLALLLFLLFQIRPDVGLARPEVWRSVLVVVVIGGAAIYWSRARLSDLMRAAGLWVLIIAGIAGVYMIRSDVTERIMSEIDPSGVRETGEGLVIRRSADGHFWLRADLNGKPVLMMVDTGASNIVLSLDDARRAGIEPDMLDFTGVAQTANGSVRFAYAQAQELVLGDAVFTDVGVTVNGGEMAGSLFGMAGLRRFSSFEFRGDILILKK